MYRWQAKEAASGTVGAGTLFIVRRAALKHPQNVHPHWNPYVAVEDVDGAAQRALKLGASLYIPAGDIPHVGRFSAIDDPTGAGVCLFRRSMSGV